MLHDLLIALFEFVTIIVGFLLILEDIHSLLFHPWSIDVLFSHVHLSLLVVFLEKGLWGRWLGMLPNFIFIYVFWYALILYIFLGHVDTCVSIHTGFALVYAEGITKLVVLVFHVDPSFDLRQLLSVGIFVRVWCETTSYVVFLWYILFNRNFIVKYRESIHCLASKFVYGFFLVHTFYLLRASDIKFNAMLCHVFGMFTELRKWFGKVSSYTRLHWSTCILFLF